MRSYKAAVKMCVVEESSSGGLHDVPPLSVLLGSIDVATRSPSDQTALRNTIAALCKRATIDGALSDDYLRLALLIGFKNRNHEKSKAPGVGSGERRVLITMLIEAYKINADMVRLVLPLVPLYGSWRDLQVIAEEAFTEDVEVGRFSCVPSLSADISQIFAMQLKKDTEELLSIHSEEDKDILQAQISNACKYAPRESRHRGSSNNRKAEKASRPHKIQRRLGDEIMRRIMVASGEQGSNCLRPRYRKMLSSLNRQLVERGHLMEPLMCDKQLHRIRFAKANKGSLAKYRKALMKDPVVAARWKKAMAKSDGAVADIDGLQDAARNMAEEVRWPEEERMFPYRVLKAISTARTVKSELQAKAAEILAQLSASGGNADEMSDLLCSIAPVPVLPVIDTATCSAFEFQGLALAAYVVARSQALHFIIVDGERLMLSEEGDGDPDTEEGRESCHAAAMTFVSNICEFASNLDSGVTGAGRGGQVRNMDGLNRVRISTLAALHAHRLLNPPDETAAGAGVVADVLYLSVTPFNIDPSEFSTMVTELQKPVRGDEDALPSSLSASIPCGHVEDVCSGNATHTPMRSLLLHRVKQTTSNGLGESVPLVLRGSGNLPSNRREVTMDLALVLDLTGSMGTWMDAAKQHLTSIVESLQSDTGIGAIRVAFIGYRDFGDNGRCVKHDFVPIARADDTVLRLMRAQRPGGGGDTPEDVLIGFTAARQDLAWESDIRVILHIADAPAHGYNKGGDDNHPSGRCPDQLSPHLSLEETLVNLKTECHVDLLFCRLNPCTDSMEEMFSSVYNNAEGFGVLPISGGAQCFRDALLSTLTASLLKTLAPDDVKGLQTYSGATMSSVFRTLNSSLRESIARVADEAREFAGAGEAVGLEGVECGFEDCEDEVAEASGDASRPADMVESTDCASERRAAAVRDIAEDETLQKTATVTARSDYERLLSELSLDELGPVRFALGMTMDFSMQETAAGVLLDNGVTVQDMVSMGYPHEVVEVMRLLALKRLGNV